MPLRRSIKAIILVFFWWFGLTASSPVAAQVSDSTQSLVNTRSDWAWRPILDADSVRVDYIYYVENGGSGGEGEIVPVADSGVVIKVTNDRHVDMACRFTLIIRSGNQAFETLVSGVVPARSLVTGDAENLYFAPFGADASIGEIGLRGYSFAPVRNQE